MSLVKPSFLPQMTILKCHCLPLHPHSSMYRDLGLLGDETGLETVFWVPGGLHLFLGSYRKGRTGQRPTAMYRLAMFVFTTMRA